MAITADPAAGSRQPAAGSAEPGSEWLTPSRAIAFCSKAVRTAFEQVAPASDEPQNDGPSICRLLLTLEPDAGRHRRW